MLKKIRFVLAFLAITCSTSMFAENETPLSPAEILKKITYPPEFTATVFASPPNISYPIFLSATPDGTLFVGCDENGSLDREPGRGRVVMCRDTDGDGKADKFTTFAKMDSPRGVAYDQSTRTLYVMHPPFLTAYHDDNNTGVANRQEDLITGLGFGLDFRGADHTINGIRLGIDGWIYIACGDYGAVKATGRDGRSFEMRGGGIVRIRPDGTGMEFVVRGTRNILAVAISPTMELFTRDNTNDGDDWNDRLSFNPFGAVMGYPTLFRNFSDETIPTMIDFGGGSPVGSIFIDEPSLPQKWANGFYSVEWGRSEIDLHPLTRSGATWKANTTQFMQMTRATDLEVDATGNLYAASWDGATFTYAGPNVGYVIRLSPKDKKGVSVPDFKKLSDAQLVDTIGSASAVSRLAAQRELMVRGGNSTVFGGLKQIAAKEGNIGPRVAALYTLKLLQGEKADSVLLSFIKNDELREYAIKALGDDPRIAAKIPSKPMIKAMEDTNPRVRLQAVTALGHLGKTDSAKSILKHTADEDYTVAHISVQALRWLKASDACLQALDGTNSSIKPGALRVLQALYDPAVVDGLLKRLDTPDAELRRGIYRTLTRLDMQEAHYTDPNMWWGTRPDTSGPIYKPERWSESDKIEAALKKLLEGSQGDDAKAFVTALLKTKVTFTGFSEIMLSKAGSDTASMLDVIAPLISPKAPTPEDLLKALSTIATNPEEKPELRARALRMLVSLADKHFDLVSQAFIPLGGAEQQGELRVAWEEFTRDSRNVHQIQHFVKYAKAANPAKRTLGATVLVNILTSTVIKDDKAKEAAAKAISGLWEDSNSSLTLLNVIAVTRASKLIPQVREHVADNNPEVAAAAKLALTNMGAEEKDSGAAALLIGQLKYEDVVKIAISNPGDSAMGQKLFLRQGCVVCHTISPKEPPKGPMLGGIAKRYSRAELCESILKPSAKIAQGFETQYFRMKNNDEYEGFVVKEGGDSVEVRSISGPSTILEKADIAERQRRTQSMMPEGIAANITPLDLSSLLAFLESTSAN